MIDTVKGLLELAKNDYKRFLEDEKHSFEVSELAGYTDNGILEMVYSFAFLSGYVVATLAIREKLDIAKTRI